MGLLQCKIRNNLESKIKNVLTFLRSETFLLSKLSPKHL